MHVRSEKQSERCLRRGREKKELLRFGGRRRNRVFLVHGLDQGMRVGSARAEAIDHRAVWLG